MIPRFGSLKERLLQDRTLNRVAPHTGILLLGKPFGNGGLLAHLDARTAG